MTPAAKNKLIRAAPIAAIIFSLAIFAVIGNTHETASYGNSVLAWLVRQWRIPGSQAGHGALVVLISAWLIWQSRHRLRRAASSPCWPALIAILLGYVMTWVGMRTQQPRLGVLALILLSAAVPAALYGRKVGGLLLFPTSYLVWAVPMGFLVNATLPLRLIASTASTALLNGIGISVVRNGTSIMSTTPGKMAIDVASACSGLQAIIALLALTIVYAYLAHRRFWARGLIIIAAVPLAIVGNVARILTVAIVALTWGQEQAVTFSHDYSGYVVFVVAVLLMTLVSNKVRQVETRDGGLRPPVQEPSRGNEPHVPGGPASRMALCVMLLTAAAALALGLTRVPRLIDTMPMEFHLPQQIGLWRGEDIHYCQVETCLKEVITPVTETEPDVCPECGSDLFAISLAEARTLPKDTRYLRRLYSRSRTETAFVSIVLTGAERSSIHRPEWCLPAQGLVIRSSQNQILRLPSGDRPVASLGVGRKAQSRIEGQYLYWFSSGSGRHASKHTERLFWTAYDAIVHGKQYNWAFVSILIRAPGEAAAGQASRQFAETLCRSLYAGSIDMPPTPISERSQ